MLHIKYDYMRPVWTKIKKALQFSVYRKQNFIDNLSVLSNKKHVGQKTSPLCLHFAQQIYTTKNTDGCYMII